MTMPVQASGMHIDDAGNLVIDADKAADAGVKSIEFIEGEPEEAREAKMQQIAAAERAIGPDLKQFAKKLWERLNRRRCYLIEREVKGRASDAERLELEELQALADECMAIFAPLPIEELEAYMRSKGIDVPDEQAGSEKA